MHSFNSRIRGAKSPCVQYGGCPVQDGDGICAEPNSLQICKEFGKMYEDKMAIIENEGGECSQEKLKLQQNWINDLTQQNEMLISVIQELEYEATEKARHLEERLQQSQQCICDAERKLNESNRTVQELQQRVNYYSSFGDVEGMARELRCKNEECESLRLMVENRNKMYSEPSTDTSWTASDRNPSKKRDCTEKFVCSTTLSPITMDSDHKVQELWPEKEKKPEKQQKSQIHPIARASNSVLKATESVVKATTKQTNSTTTEENVLICGGAKPCLIINHSTKRQTGRNTVIFINQDGSVQKHVNYCLTNNTVDHSSACSKCCRKLENIKSKKNPERFTFASCKSENDLLQYKKMLRPVKERSNLTNSTLGALARCKTFVDKSYKRPDFDGNERKVTVPRHMPVKMYVNNLELNKNGGVSLLNVINSALENYDFEERTVSDGVDHTTKKRMKTTEHSNKEDALPSIFDNQDIIVLDQLVVMKNHFFESHLLIIKTLIIKLFNIDQGLKLLEQKTQSLDLSKRTDTDTSAVKIDKKYVEQVEFQLQEFLKERNESKKKKKALEKKCSVQCKENETMRCECQNLKSEIARLKEENRDEIERLKKEIEKLELQRCTCAKLESEIQKLESEKCECENLKHTIDQLQIHMQDYEKLKYEYEKVKSEKCQCQKWISKTEFLKNEKQELQNKIKSYVEEIDKQKKQLELLQGQIEEIMEDNRKTVGELVMLNEENRNLSNTINTLRKRGDKTSNLTSKEISQLNMTIEELQTNLEQTRLIQDREEKSYQETILGLSETIFKLEGQLKAVFNKCTSDKSVICTKGKSKVSFSESSSVQVDLKNTSYEKELNEVLDVNAKMTQELKRKSNEMELLKEKVAKLENALSSCEERALNLQQAVDLSLNSIELLVISEEDIQSEYEIQNKSYEILQDLSINLEMEHLETLQSLDMLDCQVNKYKTLLKDQEVENSKQKEQVKKLSKQKKCYEEIVNYFKEEIGIMADQLSNLQQLLTLSNEQAQHESQKYINAFMEMQSLNTKLSEQLCLCQQDMSNHDETIETIRQKLRCSMQQNQELQMTIIQLNETIIELQNAVKIHEKENCAVSQSARECKARLDKYNETLEHVKQGLKDKSSECERFKEAYFNEKKSVKELQNELDQTQRKLQENQFDLIGAMEDLKEKLAASEFNYAKTVEEHKEVQAHLANVARKEAVKDQEIKRYRKIVGDLKNTMMELNSELNKTLCQKELQKKCKKVTFCNCGRSNETSDNDKYSDICGCPCEVEFYQNMVDLLKNSVSDLQSKLAQAQDFNKKLEEEIKAKNEQIEELQNDKKLKSMESDECDCLIKKLKLELEATKQNERKYEALASQLDKELTQIKQEHQSKCKQLNEESKKCREINSSKCVQLVCVQEELHNLREEMAIMVKKQAGFCNENEKLRSENVQLECTIQCLRERSKEIQEELIQYQNELCALTSERNNLIRTNRELLHELKTLQQQQVCSSQKGNQQQQRAKEYLKQLEEDINVLESDQNDIYTESKKVISNVQTWITEQKRILTLMVAKQNELANENKNLKDQIQELQSQKQQQKLTSKPISQPGYSKHKRRVEVVSPASLGSEGMASVYDQDSLPASPCPNDMCDWYSTNFRSESDYTDDEDICVNKLNSLTEEMRKSNKIWKQQNRDYNAADYAVSRDKK